MNRNSRKIPKNYVPKETDVAKFADNLREREKPKNTVDTYVRYTAAFVSFFGQGCVTQENVAEYKENLLKKGLKPSTVNVAASALNSFFAFMSLPFKVKLLPIAEKSSRADDRDLTEDEYRALVNAAEKELTGLIMRTLCSMGLRVSELTYITVKAVKLGKVEIYNKGKARTVLIPGDLQIALTDYIAANKISSGNVFLNANGEVLTRQSVWRHMQGLADRAGISKSKVFPHNLRHLFALTYYRKTGDLVTLSSIIGHKNPTTTRGYLLQTESAVRKSMDSLNLVNF